MADLPATTEKNGIGNKFFQASALTMGGALGSTALLHGMLAPGMRVQNRFIWAGVGLGLGALLYFGFRFMDRKEDAVDAVDATT